MIPSGNSKGPSRILPGAYMALSLLLLINLVNYIDRQILSAVQESITRELLPNDPDPKTKSGFLATAFLVSYMLAAPLLGVLCDRYKRWAIIAISVILWSIATGASGLAATFTMLLLTRVFVGIGEAGYGPAAPTIISDYFPVERRGLILSFFYMAIPVGSALGYAMGGMMDSRFGWRSAFFAAAPMGIILGIWAFIQKDPPRGHAAITRKPTLSDYLPLLKNKSYVLDTAGMTALTFAIGGIAYWMPEYLEWRYKQEGIVATINVKTLFGAVTAIGGIVSTLLGGWCGDWVRKRFAGAYFLVSGIGILISCPMIVGILFTPFPYCWIMIFLAVFFLFFNTGPSNTILANVTSPSIRASAFAMNILVIHALGDVVSPPLLGWIIDSSPKKDNWNSAFEIVAGVTAVAGLLWLLGVRHLQKDTELAEREEIQPS